MEGKAPQKSKNSLDNADQGYRVVSSWPLCRVVKLIANSKDLLKWKCSNSEEGAWGVQK